MVTTLASNILVKTSVFARIMIRDLFFGAMVYYLVVHNTPEPEGKPGGHSLPGGGIPEGVSLDDAIRSEIFTETGLVVTPQTGPLGEPFRTWGGKYAIRTPDRKVRYVALSEDGQLPREVEKALEDGHRVAIPTTYALDVEVVWDGSPLQKLFHRVAPLRQTENGIYLVKSDLVTLDPLPVEVKSEEIDGFVLVTPEHVDRLLGSRELLKYEGWYYEHLRALAHRA